MTASSKHLSCRRPGQPLVRRTTTHRFSRWGACTRGFQPSPLGECGIRLPAHAAERIEGGPGVDSDAGDVEWKARSNSDDLASNKVAGESLQRN